MFIHALLESGSVDWVEYGLYVSKVKVRPLAVRGRNLRPVLVNPKLPVYVKRPDDTQVNDGLFYVSRPQTRLASP
jgi:hypothetical protein